MLFRSSVFSECPVSIPAGVFEEIEMTLLKFIWTFKGSTVGQTNLKKKKKNTKLEDLYHQMSGVWTAQQSKGAEHGAQKELAGS